MDMGFLDSELSDTVDLDHLIARAMEKQELRSDRALSGALGKAHNYVLLLRTGAIKPAPEVLAKLIELGGYPEAVVDHMVLMYVGQQQKGRARETFERAIKAMSTACVVAVFSFAFGALTPHPASASTHHEGKSSVYIMRQFYRI
jgi:hypothetical protein